PYRLKVFTSASLDGEPAQGELDDGLLGASDVALAVRELAENPAGENFFEAAVDHPARGAGVDVAPERPCSLPLLDDSLDDREGLADLDHLARDVLAPRDLAHHHRDQRGIVAPGPQQDLGDAGQLLLGRLVRLLHRLEALQELAPVLDEDRLQD